VCAQTSQFPNQRNTLCRREVSPFLVGGSGLTGPYYPPGDHPCCAGITHDGSMSHLCAGRRRAGRQEAAFLEGSTRRMNVAACPVSSGRWLGRCSSHLSRERRPTEAAFWTDSRSHEPRTPPWAGSRPHARSTQSCSSHRLRSQRWRANAQLPAVPGWNHAPSPLGCGGDSPARRRNALRTGTATGRLGSSRSGILHAPPPRLRARSRLPWEPLDSATADRAPSNDRETRQMGGTIHRGPSNDRLTIETAPTIAASCLPRHGGPTRAVGGWVSGAGVDTGGNAETYAGKRRSGGVESNHVPGEPGAPRRAS